MIDKMIDRKVGPYLIQKVIGHGGMGVVYLAHDEKLERDVALKFLPAHFCRDENFVQRFYLEARTAARLSNSHIVTVYSVDAYEDTHYIAMEYVKGDSIAELLEKAGRIDVKRALEITRQVAEALAAAHDLHILHRDIKPANIMVAERGQAKVMDFGIAKRMDRASGLTGTGMMVGTPRYMSPEQCQALQVDHRADIYSLGVVLYEMLAGRPPFDEESQIALIMQVIQRPAPDITEFNDAIPGEVRRILGRMIEKDPTKRYTDARQLIREIDSYLAFQPGGSLERHAEALNRGEAPVGGASPGSVIRGVREKASAFMSSVADRVDAFFESERFGDESAIRKVLVRVPGLGPDYPPKPARLGVALALVLCVLVGIPVLLLRGGGDNGESSGAKPGKGGTDVASTGRAPGGWTQIGEVTPTPRPARTPDGAAVPEATTAPAIGTPVTTPRVAMTPVLPRLEWTAGPEEGERIRESEVTVAWRIQNEGVATGYLVGLNEDSPKLRISDTRKSFFLVNPGEQVITIIPLGTEERPGLPIRRRFIFASNQSPTVIARLSAKSVLQGQPVTLTMTASDADADDTVTMEMRVDGGEWSAAAGGDHELENLAVGLHTVEVRATDSFGGMSNAWKETIEVTPLKERLRQAVELFTGVGGSVNLTEAKNIFMAEAEAGNPLGKMWTAWFHFWGRCGFPKDEDWARRIAAENLDGIRGLADAGDPDAQFLLGAAYDRAMGTDRNPDAAIEWITLAAEGGSTTAMNYFGFLYSAGEIIRKDDAKAVTWFRRAAQLGDTSAMHNLGSSLRDGRGTERDESGAVNLFRKAAEMGSPRNMNNLGDMYEQGRGVEKNMDEAIRWYKQGARLGDPIAQDNLKRLGQVW